MTLEGGRALPSGPLEPGHRSLQAGMRDWVRTQTAQPLGYLEQLYTFADGSRPRADDGRHTISISYLGLARPAAGGAPAEVSWRNWYGYFPWEDHRQGVPELMATIAGCLAVWAERAEDEARRRLRRRRVAVAFGFEDAPWNDEMVLQRYELLYEAGLVAEAGAGADGLGRAMVGDHRRILATGIARLRAKIRYRPVVFELMAGAFTLLQLQRTVEALAGVRLHKQNFRRFIEQQNLVEESGGAEIGTGGRPAKLFRFRHAVLEERALAGSKLPLARSAGDS